MKYYRRDLRKIVDSFLEFVDQSLIKFEIEPFNYKAQKKELRTRSKDKRGVYVLSGRDGEIAYVGIGMNKFSTRVFSHFNKLPEHELEHVDLIYWDESDCRRECEFMFPALEYYLIANISPKLNETYTEYGEGLVVMDDECKHYDWFEDP